MFARDTVSEPPGWDATHEEIQRRTLEAYVLLDLTTGENTRFELGEDVVAFMDREVSVDHRGGCWIPSEGGWQGSLGMAIGGHLGFVPRLERARWRILPADVDVVRAACRIPDRYVVAPVRIGDFFIEEIRGDRIRIVAADRRERVLAEHRATALIGSVSISDLRLSPDGARLAYVVQKEAFGFAGDSQGYVLEVTPEGPRAHFLSPHLSTPRWAADGMALFGNAWDRDGQPAVFRWPIPPG